MLRKSNYKKFIIGLLPLLSFILFTNTASAQNTLTGRIYEFNSSKPISGVKVEDLKTHVIAVSTADGKFAIKTKRGDLICFSRSSFKSDTVLVTNFNYKEIFLQFNQTLLKEVNIVNKETNLGKLNTPAVAPPFGGNTVKYQTDASGNPIGGVKIMLPGGKDKMQQEKIKEAKREADDEKALQINKAFSPENLKNYIPIKGQELENFSLLYRPSAKVYYGQFNIALYVDSCYKEFVKIPAEKRGSKTFLNLSNKP